MHDNFFQPVAFFAFGFLWLASCYCWGSLCLGHVGDFFLFSYALTQMF